MNIIIFYIMFIIILLFVNLFLLYKFTIKNKKYKELYKNYTKISNELDSIIIEKDEVLIKKEELSERVDELEKGIETQFGVKVREIKNITNVNFTKLELICILSGIEKLIPNTKDKFDIRFYLDLIEKITNVIDSLGEENGI